MSDTTHSPVAYGTVASLRILNRMDTQAITRAYLDKETIYSQGDNADALFYIRSGNVKLTAISRTGKKAIIAILKHGDFFGQGCLTTKSLRSSTATSIDSSSIARVKRANIVRMIHRDAPFAKLFISHLILRITLIQEEFVDQIFSSSERRLARILLLLAGFGEQSEPKPVVLKISQETLAEMVGTTRSRVSYFMNRFRERGLIDYNGSIQVHLALLTFLKDK
jgi:CRP/FNR family transcriptional regulator, cyclic AMP receptor protein